MDGEITIGTELSTDKFDRQVRDLEKKMSREEDKKIVVEGKLDLQEQELDRAKAKVEELTNAYNKMKEAQKSIEQRVATPTQFTEYFGMQDTYGSVEKLGDALEKAKIKQSTIEQQVASTKFQYDGINQKVSEYRAKINGINLQKQTAEVNKLQNGFKNIGSHLQTAVNKAGKLALAVFGIRSAYLAVRRASSDLASYDQQYAVNLEYIRFVLTQLIAPVLRVIVSLAAQVLQFIYNILNALFGIGNKLNLSVDAFKKMKYNAGGVSKAVKQIKKDLLGFDEINMLTSQTDSGTSAGIGGVSPDFNIEELEGEPPEWMTWLKDHAVEVILAIIGIVAAVKLLQLLAKKTFGGDVITGLDKFLGKLGSALVIIATLGGLALVIKALTGFFDMLSRSGLKTADVLLTLGGILVEIALFMAAVVALAKILSTNPMALGGIVLVTLAIVSILFTIKDTLPPILDACQKFIHAIAPDVIKMVLSINASLNKIIDTIGITLSRILRETGNLFTRIFEGMGNVAIRIGQAISNVVNTIGDNFTKIFDGIVRVIQQAGDTFTQVLQSIIWFVNQLGVAINNLVDNIIRAVTKLINFMVQAISYLFNTVLAPLKNVTGLLSQVGMNIRISSVNIPKFVPRLAVGGIVNMPNKGTLVGGALAGESGREGVIPLTDQQAMAQLGREIGRNVLVNLTNITQMNGRVIGRELKQVSNEQDFAYNV